MNLFGHPDIFVVRADDFVGSKYLKNVDIDLRNNFAAVVMVKKGTP